MSNLANYEQKQPETYSLPAQYGTKHAKHTIIGSVDNFKNKEKDKELRSLKCHSDLATLSVKFRLRWRRTRTAAQAAPGRLLRHGARTFSSRSTRGNVRSFSRARAGAALAVFAPSRRRVLCPRVLAHPVATQRRRVICLHTNATFTACVRCVSTCPLERTGGRWPGRSGSSAVGARDAVWASSLSESRSFALWSGSSAQIDSFPIQIETLARRLRSHPAVSRGGCVAFTGCVSAPTCARRGPPSRVAYGPSMRRASACGADGPGSRPPLLDTWQEYDYEHAKDRHPPPPRALPPCHHAGPRAIVPSPRCAIPICRPRPPSPPLEDFQVFRKKWTTTYSYGEYYSAFPYDTYPESELATGVYHELGAPDDRPRSDWRARQRLTSEDTLAAGYRARLRDI
ncbi:hypothetical protein EVAR_87801_1 [Eumeta japonica]|uniref:Uncharacterized protein n=1 Tax=Eumeta variegata TaxID=151549 RepID=A0A4C1X501_EUMVA|nr:hypothetical protein EVAR_87801_1 [Eumeta japonica]